MQSNFDTASFRTDLVRWFQTAARVLPWRETKNPYAILVSEMMLQQTQVATVLGYYQRWMVRFPGFAELAAAPEPEVLHAWQGLGYYSRARNLHRTAKAVMEQHAGVFPRDLKTIRALPGIGRYTAGAVATFAFDQSTPVVDANIARVLSRIFEIETPVDSTAGNRQIWAAAESLQPRQHAGQFNAAIMELGALICAPRTPRCERCPVQSHCRTKTPEQFPRKKPRRTTIRLTEVTGWIEHKNKLLLHQETGPRWHGLWRLPQIIDQKSERPLLCKLVYPITHHQITLKVVKSIRSDATGDVLQWISMEDLESIPMPSPHRKALLAIRAERALHPASPPTK